MNTYLENSLTNLPSHSGNFKNRVQELEDARFLLLERRVPTLMLWGEAGVGKTSLALHLAYDLIDEGIYHSIVWTTAKDFEIGISDPFKRRVFNKPIDQYSNKTQRRIEGVFVTSLLDLYQRIIVSSGFFDEHSEDEVKNIWNDVEELEYRVLAWLKARRILLFLDDLDSWKKDEWRYVLKFISKINFPSAAVITSRRNFDPLLIPGVAPVRIAPLDQASLRKIFDDYANKFNLKIDKNDKTDIIKYSNGSPLILNLILGLIEIKSKNWLGFTNRISSEVLTDIESTINASKPIEEFLFQDLFQFITKQSQKVVITIAALKHNQKRVNIKSISKLTNLGYSDIQNSINELQSVSLINRYRKDVDNYDVHPLFINYLVRSNKKAVESLVHEDISKSLK